jgi:TRAP-type mannitol/chloroaromatic compound transport system substrate-binding protein
VLDAVKDGTVECGHAASYWYIGKDPALAFDTALPFGLNSRQQTAWMMEGGGLELMREFFKDYNIHNIPCGNTGTQMGGWFRKEIKSMADLKGLKFRVGGLAGQVLAKLGVVPQQIPPADIYPALEKGTIDATEWIGPYDDQKLGFNASPSTTTTRAGGKAAPAVDLRQCQEVRRAAQGIPDHPRGRLPLRPRRNAGRLRRQEPHALKQLIGAGTQLRPFPNDMMAAGYKAAHELYDETAAKNPKFKKIYDNWRNSATTSCSGSPSPRTASTTSCRRPRRRPQEIRRPPRQHRVFLTGPA